MSDQPTGDISVEPDLTDLRRSLTRLHQQSVSRANRGFHRHAASVDPQDARASSLPQQPHARVEALAGGDLTLHVPNRNGRTAYDQGVTYGQKRYDLAGLNITVEARDPSSAVIEERHFGRLPATTAQPDDTTDLNISIEVASSFSQTTGTSADRAAIRSADAERPIDADTTERRIASMTVTTAGTELVAIHDRGGRAACTPSSIDLTIDATSDDRWLVARQLLFVALSWTLGHHGRTVLHAALVARGQRTVLVLGGTGQGKSTVAIAAYAAGWDIHADDLVIVNDSDAGKCTVWGVPKPLTVEPGPALDALRRTDPGLVEAAVAMPSDPRQRMLLPTSALTHGATHPTAMVLVGHDDGPGELSEMTASSARQSLILGFGLAEDPHALRRAFSALITLSSLPAYHLRHAQDPDQRVEVAVRLLHDVFARSTLE